MVHCSDAQGAQVEGRHCARCTVLMLRVYVLRASTVQGVQFQSTSR